LTPAAKDMGLEIDILSIGQGDAGCGDAIAIRLWNNQTAWVIVIDGGYAGDGDAVVRHVRNVYNTTTVDLLISTHPDCDHCGGLSTVLEELTVRNVWLHQPWTYAAVAALFHEGRITPGRIRDNLREELEGAKSLDAACRRKGIVPVQPFAGLTYGAALTVLGPSEDYYARLVADFDCLPELPRPPQVPGTLRALMGLPPLHALPQATAGRWEHDDLVNRTADVTPENNSSVILWLSWDGYDALFTADAGEHSLARAFQFGINQGKNFATLNLVQMPHHGSRHNVSPEILNALLGPVVQRGTVLRQAFVSAPRDGGPKHPSKRVLNSFLRRGANVSWNQTGPAMCYRHNAPARPTWNSSIPGQPFHERVEVVEE
jgi:beta-lactamase superfamily II metal-dependent hydrolase